MSDCIFDFGRDRCSVLKVKKCARCKFFKTIKDWDDGRREAETILLKKGLEPEVVSKGYHDVMTTRKRGYDSEHYFVKKGNGS